MDFEGMGPQPIGMAAKALGLSPDTLRRWSKQGFLPHGAVVVTHGGHRRFNVRLIVGWLERREELLKQGRGA